MEVYIVESGEYEDHGFDLAAITLEAAIDALKERFAPPYIVKWDDVKKEDYIYDGEDKGNWHLTGHFEDVPGYSIKHTQVFDITKYKVYEGSKGE